MGAERRPRRILMTADTVGGVWQFAVTLCAELAAAGDRVLLATLGPLPSASQRQQAAAIPGLLLAERPSRLVWMDEPWEDLETTGAWLLELETRFRPELVHLNDFGHGELPWRAPVLLTGHSCVASWWQAVHGCEPPAEWRRYRARVRGAVAAASLLVAPSRAMLEALERHHGPLPPSRVVANGSEAPAAAECGQGELVLAAGRVWDEAKNLAALASVAPSLPWPVCIAGDGSHPDGQARTRTTGRARGAGLAVPAPHTAPSGPAATSTELPGVHLLGRLAPRELAQWFARAPIYALPARYEPFGLSVLEAALAGCALVLGDIASLREVWGDAALYVAPDDRAALRTALLQLIGDPVLRARMATRARLRAARYTPQAMADGYRSAYDALLAPANGDALLPGPRLPGGRGDGESRSAPRPSWQAGGSGRAGLQPTFAAREGAA